MPCNYNVSLPSQDIEADYQLLQRRVREANEKESGLVLARDKADALIQALRSELESVYREIEDERRAQQQQWQQQQVRLQIPPCAI